MRARTAPAVLLVVALVLALLPAGAGALPVSGAVGGGSALDDAVARALAEAPAPIARDLLPGDLVPADRNVEVPLRAADAPPAADFATPLDDDPRMEGCDYDAYPEDPDDASIKLGLIPYHDIAPTLCEIDRSSDRVSVEVVGQSTQGRDLHLVTVTAPETPEEAARQDALHELVTTAPQVAIGRFDELADYKTPFFVNSNIHGNEWEGTDASIEVISELATTTDPEQVELLERARLHFVVTSNPDGRVAGTRANAAGFDMNRDFVTQSQPEVRAVRDLLVATSPLIMLDIHGYTVTTLIEPCTKPHNDNYEYDLYIKWALPQAEAMESAIQRASVTSAAPLALAVGTEIPYRDRDAGWDDWPPIFTPMFAMHQGAIGHTIEVPLPVNTLYNALPAPALQELSRQNTVVARATIEGAFGYALDNRDEMLRDQLEVFRRGVAGEDSPGNDGDGNAVWAEQTFPRAYVIPTGDGQRSETAAARLVDMLAVNGVEVQRATRPFTVDGTRYDAGSYLVDMRQPKRGMANVMLEAGRDISQDVSSMYDISGWSLGLLWGATVTAVDEPVEAAVERVDAAAPTGAVTGDEAVAHRFELDDLAGMRALNLLLDGGAAVTRAADGGIVVAGAAPAVLSDVAEATGVTFAPTAPGGTPIERLHVAAAVTAQERHALAEMGLDVTPVSTAALNGGASLDDVDVLLVSSGLSYSSLNDTGRATVDAFLARGGGVVGRGSTGAGFNDQAGLLEVSRTSGPGSANGVVAVANDATSPVTGSSDADGHAFVYGPLWFTSLGEGVRADQRLVDEQPLVAGHWRGSGDTTPDAAAGHALVVSGVDETSARVVLFGSEPLFRAHPKGLYLQVAEALLWTAGAGADG